MLFFSSKRRWTMGSSAALLVAVSLIAGCTVEPLNSSRPLSASGGTLADASTRDILASTAVNAQSSRIGQQVRNKLLFAMNGGRLQPNGRYRIDLDISSTTSNLLVSRDSLAPTAAQVIITAEYRLVELSSGNQVSAGKRRSLAGFDRTPQSFANERAERDAANRAAELLAQQIRLSVAQTIAGL